MGAVIGAAIGAAMGAVMGARGAVAPIAMLGPMVRARILLAALVAAPPLLAGCQTNPYTGRTTLNVFSEGQEASLGAEAYQQIVSQEKVVSSGPAWDQVRRVSMRLAQVANKPDFDWEVVLIDSPQVNAWCLPGGKMGVYTGILPVTRSDEGLAVVMGHEVSHALARHGGRRMTEGLGMSIVQELLAVGLSGVGGGVQEGVLASFGMLSQGGVVLPFSRADETEADQIGLRLMAEAGFDPREAPRFWQRMIDATGGGGPPEFLSTHPSPETRIAQLEEWMPEAMEIYQRAKSGSASGGAAAPPASGSTSAAASTAAASPSSVPVPPLPSKPTAPKTPSATGAPAKDSDAPVPPVKPAAGSTPKIPSGGGE